MIETYIGNNRARAQELGLPTDLYILKDGEVIGLKAAVVHNARWREAPRQFDPIGCTNAMCGMVDEGFGDVVIPAGARKLTFAYGRFYYDDDSSVDYEQVSILLVSGVGHYAVPKDTKIADLLVKGKPKRAPRKVAAKKVPTKKATKKKAPVKKASKKKA